MNEYLLFSLCTQNEEKFAISVDFIKEIIHIPSITFLPKYPEYIRGVTSIRGDITPVIDLSIFLNKMSTNKQEKLIITETRDKIMQSWLVRDVYNILRINTSDIQPSPEMITNNYGNKKITGVIQHDNELIMVLDFDNIIHDVYGKNT